MFINLKNECSATKEQRRWPSSAKLNTVKISKDSSSNTLWWYSARRTGYTDKLELLEMYLKPEISIYNVDMFQIHDWQLMYVFHLEDSIHFRLKYIEKAENTE